MTWTVWYRERPIGLWTASRWTFDTKEEAERVAEQVARTHTAFEWNAMEDFTATPGNGDDMTREAASANRVGRL